MTVAFLAHHSIIGVHSDQGVLRRKCVAVLEISAFAFPGREGLRLHAERLLRTI
jgi:hypothetical protein